MPRLLLQSLLRFVVALLACALCYWLLLRELHHAVMVGLVGELLGSVDARLSLVLVDALGDGATILAGEPREYSVSTTRAALDVLFVGSVFLPALVLATPLRFARRLRALAVGVAVLFVVTTAQLWATSYANYLSLTGRDSSATALTQTVCNFVGLLAPLPIWWWVAGRALRRGAMAQGERVAVGELTAAHATGVGEVATGGARNAPCPCGSGRKWKKCCGAA